MNNRNHLVTFTTDFGTRDWFVGTLKGVILGLQPRACMVDLTHDIQPGNVRAGAFALAAACRFFPRGTVHVAVVDPGVGSPRAAIVAETRDYFFVGPDNGVLSLALRRERVRRIHRIENSRYTLSSVSQTFHGRDVFAPVAAHLSRGVACQRFGPEQEKYLLLNWPEALQGRGGYRGEIVYVDRFGNAITNLGNELLQRTAGVWALRLPSGVMCPVGPSYKSVAEGQPVAVPGSTGLLEVAINGRNAARRLRLRVGSKVVLGSRQLAVGS